MTHEHDMPHDGDAERLELCMAAYLGGKEKSDVIGDAEFLTRLLSSRDAALRDRDAEIERLCLAIGGLRLRIEDQGKAIERLRNVVEAARKARAQLSKELAAIAGAAETVGGVTGYELVSVHIDEHREQIESVILAVDEALAALDAADPDIRDCRNG